MRLVALLCLATLVSPGVARAGTASVAEDGYVSYDARSVDETNEVVASVSEGVLTLQDLGAPITAGNGCTSVDAHEVTCTFPNPRASLGVSVGNRADTVAVDSSPSGPTWVVWGGQGADTLIEQCKTDCSILLGEEGPDSLTGSEVWGSEGADTLTGTARSDWMVGEGGKDTLVGRRGNDRVRGGSGKDSLDGGRGADRIRGAGGIDVLSGGAGDDALCGVAGDDRLDGGDGDDRLFGGPGSDALLGRRGNDRFRTRDGVADRLLGGPGSDSAFVDLNLDVWASVQSFQQVDSSTCY